MSSSLSADPQAMEVLISGADLSVLLADSRRVTIPLAWSPRLLHATREEGEKFELLGDGLGIHPDLDEDLSEPGLLSGTPARPCGTRLTGILTSPQLPRRG